jgi:hypothetical protein
MIESQAWWQMSIIPALGRLRQEEFKFEDSLGCKARSRPDGDTQQDLSQEKGRWAIVSVVSIPCLKCSAKLLLPAC